MKINYDGNLIEDLLFGLFMVVALCVLHFTFLLAPSITLHYFTNISVEFAIIIVLFVDLAIVAAYDKLEIEF